MPADAPISADLVTVLVTRQRELGAGPAAERNAASLSAGARCVVTGQQPGLLGGPMLVLHKAAGAIAEAKRRSTPSRPVVPVFWVASDDHDWDEVNQATVLDETGHPRALSLPIRRDGRSISDIAVEGATADRLLASLSTALEGAPRRDEALALAAPPRSPCDLGSWFAAIVARLLGDSGLVFVEPHVLAPWAGDAYAALVRGADGIADAVRLEGERRRTAGLAAPLEPRAGEAPLFLRDAPRGKRRRIAFDGDRVLAKGEPIGLDRAGLEALVRREPPLASGDVVGRVLLQDALLPVDAYVAGVTETAYLAQVAPAHAALGITAPEVVPRPSASWLDESLLAALREAGIDPAAVADGSAVARVEDRGDAASGATVAPARKADRLSARVARAAETLRPRGKPQERVLSPLSIVARHGTQAIRSGLARLAGGGGRAIVPLS